MKILYDHQIFTLQKYGGVSRYFCELLDQFSQSTDVKFTIALRTAFNENLCNRQSLNPYWSNRLPFVSCHQIIPRIQKILHVNLKKRLFNNQSESVRLLKKQDFDIFHPTYYNPYFLKHLQGKPYVLTVHDMIHEIFPEHFPFSDPAAQWKKALFGPAETIIAVSENTRKDILKFSNAEPDQISVIYHGNPFEFLAHSDTTIDYPNFLSSEHYYLLFVGERAGYKNFIFFISAIAGLLKKEKHLHICCTGGGPFSKHELKIIKQLGLHSQIHVVNINNHIMPQLYANARAFVFPSLYEGFGLPVLEAFSCSCPVVMSNTSSLPEIGGDAASYFNPQDPDSLVNALESVITNDQLRENYIRKGLLRVNEFSWKKTALKTKTVYENILNRS